MKKYDVKALVTSVALVAIMAAVELSAGCASGSCGNRDSGVQGRYGTYNEYTSRRLTQVGQITEPMLLNQLDKQGRRAYFSMDEAGRQRALQLANSGQFKNKNDAVAAATNQSATQSADANAQMLQNGLKK